MKKIKLEDKDKLLQLAIIREVIFLLGAKELDNLYSWTIVRTVMDSELKLTSSKKDGAYVTVMDYIPTEGLSYESKYKKIYIKIILIGRNLSELEEIIVIWKDDFEKEHQECISGRILEGFKLRVLEKYKNFGSEIFNNLQELIEEENKQHEFNAECNELFFDDYGEYLDGVF